MLLVIFFGRMAAGLPEYTAQTPTVASMPDNFDAENPDTEGLAYLATMAKLHHFTYVFNIFVFLQVFNMINCRKIGKYDLNVFEDFFHNFYFLAMITAICVTQVVMCQFFSGLTQTVPMSKREWGCCVIIGATSLAISALLKLTPTSWVENIDTNKFADEDKQVSTNLMANLRSMQSRQETLNNGEYRELDAELE